MSGGTPSHLPQLRKLLGELAGQDLSSVDPKTCFLDLGFDSLFLTQVASTIKGRFGVKVTFRQLLESLTTLETLSGHLDAQSPLPKIASTGPAAPRPAAPVVAPSLGPLTTPTLGAAADLDDKPLTSTLLDRVIREQLRVMEQQLTLVRRSAPGTFHVPQPADNPTPEAEVALPPSPNSLSTPASSVTAPLAQHGPFRQLEKGPKGGLTEQQQAHLDAFIPRYTARTPASKEYTQKHRKHLADPRAVAGFKLNWKEMVYPIVCTRSSGPHLWDLDGNQWVDVTMGFGVALLGHSPAFITEAVRNQLDLGVEIGPQSPLAGDVAELICEFTGMERVTFCNTGSEAVMAALRICRTVTGRTRVVLFSGAYHGTFDEVLVKGAWLNGAPRTVAIAPGVSANLISEVVVLEYGTPQSLEWIRSNVHELAAVLVETVQSRHPDLQPKEFLAEIRKITAEAETPLIFDEVITGFRCHPGGAQKHFGIEADLATYGKIVGGGMPFGFLAGKAWLMDAFDGGCWNYGDDSFPPSGVTFFAGTFVRHPLAMAAAKVMLEHLKKEGASLQESIARKTTSLIGELNGYFEQHQVPLHLEQFTSVWYPHFGPEVKFGSLLYFHLREKGLHIWEGRPCFLSSTHTDENVAFIAKAFKQSVAEMQLGGFLPGTSDEVFVQDACNRCGIAAPDSMKLATTFPLTEAQKEMWLAAQIQPEASGTFNACTVIELKGDLAVDALGKAVQQVVDRHEALRATFSEDGESIRIAPQVRAPITQHNFRDLPPHERQPRLNALLEAESRHLFNLSDSPLFRFQLVEMDLQHHVLLFNLSMSVCDGWGINVVLEELSEIYSSWVEGRVPQLGTLIPLRRYQAWLREDSQVQAGQAAESFWLKEVGDLTKPLSLPFTHPRPVRRNYQGARETLQLPPEHYSRIKQVARSLGATPFAYLLASYQAWLARLNGASDLVVGVPFAGQAAMESETLVGQCVHTLPLRNRQDLSSPFRGWVEAARKSLLDAQENWNSGIGTLSQKLESNSLPGKLPLSALFNLDPPMGGVRFSGLRQTLRSGPRVYFQYDVGFNLIEDDAGLLVEFDYNPSLLTQAAAVAWLADFRSLLDATLQNPESGVAALPLPLCDVARKNLSKESSHLKSPPKVEPPTLPTATYIAPRNETEARLVMLWEEILKVQRVGIRDNFFDLGGQSLRAVALFKRIERDFGRKLPLATLFQGPTVEHLASTLTGGVAPLDVWSPLVAIQSLGKHSPLFLVHGAGGNVLLYQALARRLAPDYPLYGLQSRGLDGKSPPIAAVEGMAAHYLAEIRRIQPVGPYFIGGYCMGGTIAYEMAQQLLAAGQTVALVAMLDTYNYAVANIRGGLGIAMQRLRFHLGNFWQLPAPNRATYLKEKWRVLCDGEWMNLFGGEGTSRSAAGSGDEMATSPQTSVQASNDEASLAYRPKPLATRITLFHPQVNYAFYPDPNMGFGTVAKGGIDRVELPVNPHAMLVEPFVENLAIQLKLAIDRAQAAVGKPTPKPRSEAAA